MLDAVRSGRPRTSVENIKNVRQAFSRSLMKFIRTAAGRIGITTFVLQNANVTETSAK